MPNVTRAHRPAAPHAPGASSTIQWTSPVEIQERHRNQQTASTVAGAQPIPIERAAESNDQKILIKDAARVVLEIVVNAERARAASGNVWNESAGQRRIDCAGA